MMKKNAMMNIGVYCADSLSCVQLFVAPCAVACQVLLSIKFSRQEYRSGCHFLHYGIFLIRGLNPCLPHWQANSFTTSTTWEAHIEGSCCVVL